MLNNSGCVVMGGTGVGVIQSGKLPDAKTPAKGTTDKYAFLKVVM